MDVLKSLDVQGQAILAISKNTNNNILALYWDGSEIVPKWVLRDSESVVTSVKDVDLLQKMVLGATLTSQDDGSLKLTFALNIFDKDRELFFAEDASGNYSLIYRHENSAAHLKDVFVDMDSSKAVCRSFFQNKEIFETIDVNLGPFKSFV
jgi:hypothetical protein